MSLEAKTNQGFSEKALTEEQVRDLKVLTTKCRKDILAMTYLAKSGHPGGSMSSIDLLATALTFGNFNPLEVLHPERDRLVVSHGHISPGVYSILARKGYFPLEEALVSFRRGESDFPGHVESLVPGVEWTTGNLGEGLAAGIAMTEAARIKGLGSSVYVFMGDGEQQEGQIDESRRLAAKLKIGKLVGIIDNNKKQISGDVQDIMPQNLVSEYDADKWIVLSLNGHAFPEIYQCLQTAGKFSRPTVLIAQTKMGKGVSFMEDKHEYHGKALSKEEYVRAIAELNEQLLALGEKPEEDYTLELEHKLKEIPISKKRSTRKNLEVRIETGEPVFHATPLDCRSAYGNAVLDLATLNPGKILAVDCDLMDSVKLGKFAEHFPQDFYEAGINEQTAATFAGALSKEGYVVFFSTFGIFGSALAYNQQRLNDINETNLKTVLTHCGLDVGHDGPTHHSLDYLALMNNLFHTKAIIPADANQTDKVIRYIAATEGNFFVAMGRSKLPLLKVDGKECFSGPYAFQYGKDEWLFGTAKKDVALVTMGTMVHKAFKVRDILEKEGLRTAIVNKPCPKEADGESLARLAEYKVVFTYEDHHVETGLGSIMSNQLSGICKVVKFGVSRYAGSGAPEELYKTQGLDEESVALGIKTAWERLK